MSELDANVVIDGQRAIATVAQTGTVIKDGGEIDATCVVQTDDGPQKAVKTYDLNGGGGGGTVDQTYDATSTNAQSGTAVAEAVQPCLKNKATNPNYSLMITTGDYTITGSSSVIINPTVNVNQSVSRATGLGTSVSCNSNSTCIGYYSFAQSSSVSVGMRAISNSQYGVSIGASTSNNSWDGANVGSNSNKAIAIGTGAQVSSAEQAIQLGQGTNSTANTFQVYSYPMLDGTTGKIPMARLPIVQISQADYDALVSGGTVDANTLYLIV